MRSLSNGLLPLGIGVCWRTLADQRSVPGLRTTVADDVLEIIQERADFVESADRERLDNLLPV